MFDIDLYQQVLRPTVPWKVVAVPLDMESTTIHAHFRRGEGFRWKCPKREQQFRRSYHADERIWRQRRMTRRSPKALLRSGWAARQESPQARDFAVSRPLPAVRKLRAVIALRDPIETDALVSPDWALFCVGTIHSAATTLRIPQKDRGIDLCRGVT